MRFYHELLNPDGPPTTQNHRPKYIRLFAAAEALQSWELLQGPRRFFLFDGMWGRGRGLHLYRQHTPGRPRIVTEPLARQRTRLQPWQLRAWRTGRIASSSLWQAKKARSEWWPTSTTICKSRELRANLSSQQSGKRDLTCCLPPLWGPAAERTPQAEMAAVASASFSFLKGRRKQSQAMSYTLGPWLLADWFQDLGSKATSLALSDTRSWCSRPK